MFVVVFITAKDVDEANKISAGLVKDKLIACANIIPGVKSVFWWEGKVDRAEEVLLVLKTKKIVLPKLIKMVKSVHSYSCPEIIALPILGGNKDYLKWVNDSVKTK